MSKLVPAITDIEKMKDRFALAKLLNWNAAGVQSARFDRDQGRVRTPEA
jgi:hypothetical protein